MRQQGVEFVVRQIRDDLPGERDRVDKVDASQRRAVLPLIVDDVGLSGSVLGYQQVRSVRGEPPVERV